MAQPKTQDAAERRVNQLLRHALDKFLQGDHARVNAFDVYLFQATRDKIAALPHPGPMQLRLRDLVERALRQYADLAAAAVTTSAEAGVSDAGKIVHMDALLEGVRARPVGDVGGILLDAQVRVCEHAGPLTVQGDVPEDTLIVVRHGGLTVQGALQGHGLADEGVRVFGNIQGGCVVSLLGDIAAERVLAGARLAAPQGDIQAAAIERAGLLFAGGAIRVSGDLLGSACRAGRVVAEGGLRGSEVHVLHSVEAGVLEGDSREPTRVVFRRVLGAREYGRAFPEEVLARLRTLTRAHFGAVAGGAFVAALHGEWCNAQRALLIHLAGGTDIPLEAVRTAQLLGVFHGWHAAATEALLHLVQECEELDAGLLRGAAMQAAEDCQGMTRALERDVGALPDEVARGAKEPLLAAGRHLSSLARKIQEAAQRREPLEPLMEAAAQRALAWRAAAAGALEELERHLPAMDQAIGHAAAPGQAADKLQVFVQVEAGRARKDPARSKLLDGPLYRGLAAAVERAKAGMAQWTRQTDSARAAWEEQRAALCGEGWLVAPPDPRGPRLVRATRCSGNVAIAGSPLASGGEDIDVAHAIRLSLPVEHPVAFHAEGLLIRREPPRIPAATTP